MKVNFVFERDTKNKRRFNEVVAEGGKAVVGPIYFDKESVPEGTPSVEATFALAAVVAPAAQA
jgi:hypothetical protein